ncbi:lipase member H-like [Protopterus annectens]|uniref:lipase member H-like n=1 Tax=Protopterus annectens TaxID=7888 RepID=UPI001CFC39E3|nr:lipase member H-like [Protopterus annectens]
MNLNLMDFTMDCYLLSALFLGTVLGNIDGSCHDFRRTKVHSLHVQLLEFRRDAQPCGTPVDLTALALQVSMNPDLPITLIIHGNRPWKVRPAWVGVMGKKLLTGHRGMVFAVDWLAPRNQDLVTVATEVGKEVSNVIHRIQSGGVDSRNVHLIGFGTGAHIAGVAGAFHYGKLGRITGLDPFARRFSSTGPSHHLDYTDGQFVDVIHTNYQANPPIPALGIARPIGHIDFFVGKGKKLNGCPRGLSDRESYVLCHHRRAYKLYLSSISGKCPFTAFPCSSYSAFKKADCVNCNITGLTTCPQLGDNISWLPRERPVNFHHLKAFLDITKSPPYCVTYFLLEVKVGGHNSFRAYLFLRLKGKGIQTSSLLASRSITLFEPGKVYKFLISADKKGNFHEIHLQLYTTRYVYLDARKKKLIVDQLTLTPLPLSGSFKLYASNVTLTENKMKAFPLRRVECHESNDISINEMYPTCIYH